jgi:hypothetical protein
LRINDTLVDAYGWESDNWIGHVVELSVGDGQFQGKAIKVIKVRPISKPEHYGEANKQPEPVQRNPDLPPPAQAEDRKSAGGGHSFDDEIPFAPEWR